MRVAKIIVLSTAFLLAQNLSFAQESEKPPPSGSDQGGSGSGQGGSGTAAPQPAADVVRLKNGSLFRGTISERVQGEYVEIVLASGKTRRFTMDEVEYAGPATEAPTHTPPMAPTPPGDAGSAPAKGRDSARPLVTIHGQEARVSLTSEQSGVTFHRRSVIAVGQKSSAAGYDELCTSPCEISLPAGTYTLALSRKKGELIEADPVAIPSGQSRIDARFASQSGLRTGLLLGGIGLGVVGAYLYSTSEEDVEECSEYTGYCFDTTETNETKLLLGITGASIGLGMVVYSFLLADKVELQVRAAPPRASSSRARSGGAVEFAGRF